MGAVSVVTRERSWFGDAHRRARTLRLTPHPGDRVVTLSMWEGNECRATVRLADSEVPALIGALAEGLAASAAHGSAAQVLGPEPARVAHLAAVPSDGRPGETVADRVPGPVAGDGQPTEPPMPAEVLATAVSRAVLVIGRGARVVADRLAPRTDDGPPTTTG